jgi:hypothetical protein
VGQQGSLDTGVGEEDEKRAGKITEKNANKFERKHFRNVFPLNSVYLYSTYREPAGLSLRTDA